ncbi:MAG: DUF167 domain-containing protein [Bacillota bacterium]|nr:MAG: DUF167 domain-containing protein [Bacillota bacterium]
MGPPATFRVRARPGASRTEIAGFHGDALAVRLAAPPEKGRANRALLSFLATELRLRPSDLRIVAGSSSRDKIVEIRGLPHEELQRRLMALAGPPERR